jgi:hypothetical protein
LSLAARAGFVTSAPYCSHEEMVRGIRALEGLPDAAVPTEQMALALLENLRRLLHTTAARSGREGSLAAQSRLPRWNHLRRISPNAADAYAAVLRYHQVEVPQCPV